MEYVFSLLNITKKNIEGTIRVCHKTRRSCDDAFSYKRPVTRGFMGFFKKTWCGRIKKRGVYGWTFSPQVLQNLSVGSSSALHFLHRITFPAGWP
jgi:hypothetical protein